jgi:glycerol-3-phosphate O-acyltransferase
MVMTREKNHAFEQLLVALHPIYRKLKKRYPDRFKMPESVPAHPSAMLRSHNVLYKLLMPRVFRRISVDPQSIAAIQELAKSSTLVFVGKSVRQLEYHFFNHLFSRESIPLAVYTNTLTLRRWMKWTDLKGSIVKQSAEVDEFGHTVDPIFDGSLEEMIANGESALLEIPPSNLEDEGLIYTAPLQALASVIRAQKHSDKPISIIPLDLLWSRRPKKPKPSLMEILFGEKESPGSIRRTVLFWRNYGKQAQATFGRPIDLQEFVGDSTATAEELAQKLRTKLSDALSAQRRTVTGPPLRPRSWFVHEVTTDEQLDAEICQIATERGKDVDDLRELAKRYVHRMAADFDYTYLELFDRVITHVFNKLYDSFDVDTEGVARAKELYENGPVIFVPNHKSHVDYLILSHILYHNGMTTPLIAAGDNMNFWPLGKIFRHSGAFFIRRSFRGNNLYRAVLEAYLKVLLKEGYSQVFFIEGGRSRTGKLGKPRMGMLSMLENAAGKAKLASPTLIPVSITYDRVIEQKSYVDELKGGAKKKEGTGIILGLTKYLKKQRMRYGSIYVRFGEAIKADSNQRDDIAKTALEICHRINKGSVVTPASVAATALLTNARRGVTLEEFNRSTELILDYMKKRGAELSSRFSTSTGDALDLALSQFATNGLISARHDAASPFIAVDDEKRIPLAMFKNSSVHYMMTMSVICTIIGAHADNGITKQKIIDELIIAKRLLLHEFRFATSRDIEKHVDGCLDYLIESGAIKMTDDRVTPIDEAMWQIEIFRSGATPFFEALMTSLTFVSERMKSTTKKKTLVDEIRRTGEDFLLLDRIQYRESLMKDLLLNSLNALNAFGAITLEESDSGAKRQKSYAPPKDASSLATLKAELERFV